MAGEFVKSFNALISGGSFLAGSVTGRPFIAGMPVSVSTELTNCCNLRCPECTSGTGLIERQRGFMSLDLFNKVISELKPYLYYLTLYFQGEPMIHPQFGLFPQIAKGIRTIMSTNGHFLDRENSRMIATSGLWKLIISLDGMDQTTYSRYRINGNLNTVKQGIMNVSEAIRESGSPMKLELQFLVSLHNEHQISEARKFAAENGASLRLKSMQVMNQSEAGKWMPAAEKFRRYRKSADGTFIIKSALPNRCLRLYTNPVITWDGKVLPCCYDKDGRYEMGDLNKESFRSVWNGTRYREFRRQILSNREKAGICRNCTSGLTGVRY